MRAATVCIRASSSGPFIDAAGAMAMATALGAAPEASAELLRVVMRQLALRRAADD